MGGGAASAGHGRQGQWVGDGVGGGGQCQRRGLHWALELHPQESANTVLPHPALSARDAGACR